MPDQVRHDGEKLNDDLHDDKVSQDQESFIEGVAMKPSFDQALAYLFTAAKVAGIRNRLYSKKASRDGNPVLAGLLKALESSESAHVRRFLMYLRGKTSDSETFLDRYRESKLKEIAPLYARMAQQYDADGQAGKAENLRQFERVLAAQAKLIARFQAAAETMPPDVYTCRICGFVTTDKPAANCPVCNAVKEKFDCFALSETP
jgi:rubrerythrin